MRKSPALHSIGAPDGALDCSHGWSGAAAKPSPRNPWFSISQVLVPEGRRSRSDLSRFWRIEFVARGVNFHRPIRGGILFCIPRVPLALHPWLHSVAPSGAKLERALESAVAARDFVMPN